jgi:hypothetical protein
MKRVNIRHWQSSHNDWLRALKFYKDELNLLKLRLTGIAGRNTHTEVLQQVEHFEHQFLIQQNNIDEMVHDIHINLNKIAHEVDAQAGFIDEPLIQQMEKLKLFFMEEEKTILELRHAFNLFCAEWM